MHLRFATTMLLAACSAGGGEGPLGMRPLPDKPAGGTQVAAGADLQAQIDAAPPGATLILAAGSYQGPVKVQKALMLWGPTAAVIRGRGEGSTVRLEADGACLLGCTVDGTGQRFELLDSAVHVRGNDNRVEGVTIRNALFGILVESSARAQIRNNRVIGTGQAAIGLRGDGIRLWETTDSEVVGNHVTDCRDMVVWYSSRNRVRDNVVTGCRYGTHFMYSHDCVLEGNSYVDDVVGCFVMYCHGMRLHHNVMARAGGAAGIGIGAKESGNLDVHDNWLVANATGIYLDTSPLDLGHHNQFARNVFALCEIGVSFHSSPQRNEFADNCFRDNGTVIKVGGDGDALGSDWHGNYFNTYRGYDLDGDGVGDVPFEFRRLSTQLEGRYQDLAMLHGAPAMQMLDVVGELMPLFQPRQLLVDHSPRMQPQLQWQPQELGHAR